MNLMSVFYDGCGKEVSTKEGAVARLISLTGFPDSQLKDYLLHASDGVYAGYEKYFCADSVAAYYWKQFDSDRSQESASGVVALEDNDVVGVGLWRALPWDTRILGYPCAQICTLRAARTEIALQLLGAIKEDQDRTDAYYCFIRLSAQELHLIQACEKYGFIMIDGLLTFARYGIMETNAGNDMSPGITIGPAQERDIESVANIARGAFVHGRFYDDPAIPREVADRVYAEWARELCARNLGAVMVARDDAEVIGFVALRLDDHARFAFGQPIGIIVLIAVADHARGQLVARNLTAAAVSWCNTRCAMLVQVGTQLCNMPASRLYLTSGFDLIATSVTLRIIYDGR